MVGVKFGRYFREDFDRGKDFVVKRQFKSGSKVYVPGILIDKTAFTVRRLRQLYDMRMIDNVLKDIYGDSEERNGHVVVVSTPEASTANAEERLLEEAPKEGTTRVRRRVADTRTKRRGNTQRRKMN